MVFKYEWPHYWTTIDKIMNQEQIDSFCDETADLDFFHAGVANRLLKNPHRHSAPFLQKRRIFVKQQKRKFFVKTMSLF